MSAKVIDASVAAAWCFREPMAKEAFSLLSGAELHAPSLLAYELTSIARRKVENEPANIELISEALRTVLSLPINWSDVNHPAVMEIALAENITTYDASYLYLAGKIGAPLVTFDKVLNRVSRKRLPSPRIKD